MHSDVLTNCTISLDLSRNSTAQLSPSPTKKKNIIMMMTNFARSDSCDNNETEKQTKKKVPPFTEALAVLCHYSLVNTYPTLCLVYAIAVAILTVALRPRSVHSLHSSVSGLVFIRL